MKHLVFVVLIFLSFECYSQYFIGKTSKELKKHLATYNFYEEKINDSTIGILVDHAEFIKVLSISKKTDSCVLEVVGFKNIDYQLSFIKEIEEKWIKEKDKVWYTYIKGNKISARFYYWKEYDIDCIAFNKQNL